MKIISSAFEHEGLIPSIYTCDGRNVNPPLDFSDVPAATKSLALIMDDPDVPKSIRPDGVWDHWVLFNISPMTEHIHENTNGQGVFGINSGEREAYGGPCPPDREHRYFFKLYAVDILLDLTAGAKKSEVETAIIGHIIDTAELMGRYNRKK